MSNLYKKRSNQKGFTIVELMIATSVFSVVLLLCSYGLIQIGKLYYKGITSTRTQNTARSILDSISQDIEFADNNIVINNGTPTTMGMICAGHHRYSYQINLQLNNTNHVLILDDLDCQASTLPKPLATFGANDQEFLGRSMRLADLRVTGSDAAGYTVLVRVAYGDNDLLIDSAGIRGNQPGFDPGSATCASGAGSQFCAVSTLSTFVKKRL